MQSSKASTPLPEPPKFSWVVPNKLAAHALPVGPKHVQYLWEVGIRHVVSVMKDRVTLQCLADSHMNWTHISVGDLYSPSLKQVNQFLGAVEKANSKGEALSVHCRMGRGRTGTMLACYLVKTKHITATEAIAQIREMRPRSVESEEQEDIVQEYYLKVKDTWFD